MKVLLVNPAVRPDSPKCILNVGLGYVATAEDAQKTRDFAERYPGEAA